MTAVVYGAPFSLAVQLGETLHTIPGIRPLETLSGLKYAPTLLLCPSSRRRAQ